MGIEYLKERAEWILAGNGDSEEYTRTPSQVKQDEIWVAVSKEYEAIKEKLSEKKNELAASVNSVKEPASDKRGTASIVEKSDEFREYVNFVENIEHAFELLHDVVLDSNYIEDIDMLEKILDIANDQGLMSAVVDWMGEEDIKELLRVGYENSNEVHETIKIVLEGLVKREEMYA